MAKLYKVMEIGLVYFRDVPMELVPFYSGYVVIFPEVESH